jgi:hypothetical protein
MSKNMQNTLNVTDYPRTSVSDIFSGGRYIKILLILGFLLGIYNLLVLYYCQPQEYIVDIYSALPLSFYAASIFCYFASSMAIFSGGKIERKWGILLLILNQMVILLIPFMLGYYSMGRADDMSYIGEYLHICNTGAINLSWDIYPGSLIIGAVLSIILGLPVNVVSFIIPFVFSLIFSGGIYLCCRCFLKDEKLANLGLLSSFFLYLGPYNFFNVPHALFFAYMPLFIFFLFQYIQKPTLSHMAVLLIPTILIPITHPFIVFFVTAFLIILVLLGPFLKHYISLGYRYAIGPLLLVIVGFLAWFIYCNTLMRAFRISNRAFFLGRTEPVLYETTDKLARIHIDFFKMMKLLFVYYGRYFIPLIIICIAVILIYLKRGRISQFLKNHLYFFLLFYLLFFAIEAVLFLNPVISHQPDRLTNLNFMVYTQVPAFVIALSVIFAQARPFNGQAILLLLLLTGIWSMSLFGTFDSPNTFRTSAALTHNEVDGMRWFYDERTNENVIVPLSQIDRFHELFDDGGSDYSVLTSDHFGYNSTPILFTQINPSRYPQQSYVILLTLDELLYQKIPGYQDIGRYTQNDYVRFRNDYSVSKIYQNSNIEIYSTKDLE